MVNVRLFLSAGLRRLVAVAALGADEAAGPGRQRREGDAVFAAGLLHPGAAQVVEDNLAEVVARAVAVAGFGDAVDNVAVLVHAQHAVGRDAFDGEGAGHAHAAAVFVGLVVQVLVLGAGGDGGVDFPLPGDAQVPVVSEPVVSVPGANLPAAPWVFPIPPVAPRSLTTDH